MDLSRVSLFERLTDEERKELAGLLSSQKYKEGALVISQDTLGESLFLLDQGSVKVTLRTDKGETKLLNVMGPGSFFGEIALIEEGSTRSASVTTTEPSVLWELNQKDFREFAMANPPVLWKVAQALCVRLRKLGETMAELSFRDVPYRLLKRLGDLADLEKRRAEESGEKGEIVIRNLSSDDLAALVGSDRDTVRRHLERFDDLDLVKIKLVRSGGLFSRPKLELVVQDFTSLKRAPEFINQW